MEVEVKEEDVELLFFSRTKRPKQLVCPFRGGRGKRGGLGICSRIISGGEFHVEGAAVEFSTALVFQELGTVSRWTGARGGRSRFWRRRKGEGVIV